MSDERPLALELSDVSRQFSGIKAVNGVSLQIPAGERHAIVGPNGAGKTTLFNLVSGEMRVDTGRISLHGRDITRTPLSGRVRQGLGRTFQHAQLFPQLTVRESVALAHRRRQGVAHRLVHSGRQRAEVDAVVEETLTRAGLEPYADLLVESLPHGTQRQLEVAVALATGPSVLLLDEPTAGLAAAEADRMVSLVAELPADLTVVLIEHDMDVVFAIAHRITVLAEGRRVCTGPPDEVTENDEVRDLYLGSFGAEEMVETTGGGGADA